MFFLSGTNPIRFPVKAVTAPCCSHFGNRSRHNPNFFFMSSFYSTPATKEPSKPSVVLLVPRTVIVKILKRRKLLVTTPLLGNSRPRSVTFWTTESRRWFKLTSGGRWVFLWQLTAGNSTPTTMTPSLPISSHPEAAAACPDKQIHPHFYPLYPTATVNQKTPATKKSGKFLKHSWCL